jgi:type II restriction enzyme
MDKIEEAKKILKTLGLPPAQQNDISALTLLALCGIKENDPWKDARIHSVTVTKGIMYFVSENYHRDYKPNSRETFRRQVLHQFEQAHIIDYNPDDPKLPTNSPNAHYAITEDALAAIRIFNTNQWDLAAKEFVKKHGSLDDAYQKKKIESRIPIILPSGVETYLSPGKHNEVQASIIHEFIPRFAPGSEVLYLGDTAKKSLIIEENKLADLKIPISEHDKLPDVIIFDSHEKILYLFEAVTSHGPMNPKRVMELEDMLKECNVKKIYMTAFPDFAEFRRNITDIAWDTDVWVAEVPDHIIHYNGRSRL